VTARAVGESAKQPSPTRRKPSHKGDRPIDFFKCRVVIFFIEAGIVELH
jgi:hypothetical protein